MRKEPTPIKNNIISIDKIIIFFDEEYKFSQYEIELIRNLIENFKGVIGVSIHNKIIEENEDTFVIVKQKPKEIQ